MSTPTVKFNRTSEWTNERQHRALHSFYHRIVFMVGSECKLNFNEDDYLLLTCKSSSLEQDKRNIHERNQKLKVKVKLISRGITHIRKVGGGGGE